MAKENFEACMQEVLRHEGGFSRIRSDPGNWTGGKVGVGVLKGTKYGISAAAYPNIDIKNISVEFASRQYKKGYWDAVDADNLPAGLDLVAFDAAVNSGPSRSAKWLQAGVGAKQDGKIGPATIAAARAYDTRAAINRACDARLAFLRSLGTWPTFGKGWSRRVASVRSTALAMAAPPRPAPKPAVYPPANSPAAPQTGFWAWLNRIFGGTNA